MFTGIITDKGIVHSVDKAEGGDLRLGIQTAYDLSTVAIGASISCSGCCLTVVKKEDAVFFVEVSAESLSKTTIRTWRIGTVVNLERALKVGDELGGHLVSGHVDGLAVLKVIEKEGDSHRLSFSVPEGLAQYIASKGSVTLNGVSLTVNEVEDKAETCFGVNIIPHTFQETNLGHLTVDESVHIEIDMLARYVARIREVMLD